MRKMEDFYYMESLETAPEYRKQGYASDAAPARAAIARGAPATALPATGLPVSRSWSRVKKRRSVVDFPMQGNADRRKILQGRTRVIPSRFPHAGRAP